MLQIRQEQFNLLITITYNNNMRFISNVNDDVQLIVEIEMEEDIKREAFVWTNENPASKEDDINSRNSRCIQYKQGRHLAIYLISNTLLTCIVNYQQRTL